MKNLCGAFVGVLLWASCPAFAGSALWTSVGLDSWIDAQANRSEHYLLANISPPGTRPGTLIASPSRHNPDYFFHWIRDAALCMDHLVRQYESATTADDHDFFANRIWDYVAFSRDNQLRPNLSGGLGEPKFHVDGSAFNGDWGRPQNDGPALRAITLIRFAKQLWLEGHQNQVRLSLYDTRLPSSTVIKTDLEYVSHHWREAGYDLWEETKGQHFYTRLVQRRALLEGAELAELLGDTAAAGWYRANARQLEDAIRSHWDGGHKFLRITLDQQNMEWKTSGIDVAVVLAVLHAAGPDDFYAPTGDQVLATAAQIRDTFRRIYPINHTAQLGVAIGRYPEDLYDGNGSTGGNPWFLNTLAFAEFHYRLAALYKEQGKINVTHLSQPFFEALPVKFPLNAGRVVTGNALDEVINALRAEGDKYIERVRYHADGRGSLSEQINRYSGYMQGARDLTWSYASFLTATRERTALLRQ